LAWVSLSALCLTILIVANHAVEAIASHLKSGAVAAIASDTGSDSRNTRNTDDEARRGADDSAAPETDDSSRRFGDCERGKCRGRRNRNESSTTSDDSLRSSVIMTGDQCEEAFKKNKKRELYEIPLERNGIVNRKKRGTETTAGVICVPSVVKVTQTEGETRDNAGAAAPKLSTKPHNWYCKNNDNHARPPLPSEFKFITKHDGYWLGKDDSGKVIYLTFDAGYENGNVKKVLDILKEKNVPGAFFLLEHFVRRNPELVMRMASEGHFVCNHTSRHKDMTQLSEEEFTRELASLERAVKELAGVEMAKYYRPPCGSISERDLALAKKLGYKTIMWSYAYADWDNNAQPVPEKALEKLLGHTHEGMVLLLHPTSATNAQILDDFIDRMIADGWRFGTLAELTAS
jgi:peptidoglycan-N-acetylmuramic acid deacetylase